MTSKKLTQTNSSVSFIYSNTKTACTKPPAVERGNYDEEDNLEDNYREGSELTFYCDNIRSVFLPESGVIRCTSEGWDHQPKCSYPDLNS